MQTTLFDIISVVFGGTCQLLTMFCIITYLRNNGSKFWQFISYLQTSRRPLIQLRVRFESGIPVNYNNISELPL